MTLQTVYDHRLVVDFMRADGLKRGDHALAFAYLLTGGIGPVSLVATTLKARFDKLPPWEQANVTSEVADVVHGFMMQEFRYKVGVARASGQQWREA